MKIGILLDILIASIGIMKEQFQPQHNAFVVLIATSSSSSASPESSSSASSQLDSANHFHQHVVAFSTSRASSYAEFSFGCCLVSFLSPSCSSFHVSSWHFSSHHHHHRSYIRPFPHPSSRSSDCAFACQRPSTISSCHTLAKHHEAASLLMCPFACHWKP